MANQPPDNPVLREIIERVIDENRHLLPAETLEMMREEMTAALASYPYPAALLRKLSQSPVVQKSGPRPTEANGAGSPHEMGEPVPGRARGGGR